MSYIFSKTSSSYISGNETFLYFIEKKFFLIFWEMELTAPKIKKIGGNFPSSKKKKNTLKKFLLLREMKFSSSRMGLAKTEKQTFLLFLWKYFPHASGWLLIKLQKKFLGSEIKIKLIMLTISAKVFDNFIFSIETISAEARKILVLAFVGFRRGCIGALKKSF